MLRMGLICRDHTAQARPVEGSLVWVLKVSWGGQEENQEGALTAILSPKNTPAVLDVLGQLLL